MTVDKPRGFRPVGHFSGGTPQRLGNRYTIASGYGTAIGYGDPVRSSGTGNGIVIGTATGAVLGVFQGCKYIDANGEVQFKKNWPASTTATEIEAYVIDDPYVLFSVQADGAVTAANLGQSADLTIGTVDSNGNSTTEISSSSIGASNVFKILRVDEADPNNAVGTNTDVIGMFSIHENRGTLTSV